jgi:hypothetical protein
VGLNSKDTLYGDRLKSLVSRHVAELALLNKEFGIRKTGALDVVSLSQSEDIRELETQYVQLIEWYVPDEDDNTGTYVLSDSDTDFGFDLVALSRGQMINTIKFFQTFDSDSKFVSFNQAETVRENYSKIIETIQFTVPYIWRQS